MSTRPPSESHEVRPSPVLSDITSSKDQLEKTSSKSTSKGHDYESNTPNSLDRIIAQVFQMIKDQFINTFGSRDDVTSRPVSANPETTKHENELLKSDQFTNTFGPKVDVKSQPVSANPETTKLENQPKSDLPHEEQVQKHVNHFKNHFECKWDGMNKKHYIAFSPTKSPAQVLKYIQEKVPEEQQLDVIAGIYENCVKEFPQAKNVLDDFLTQFAGFSEDSNYKAADKFPQALGPHLDNEQQEFMHSMFQANRRKVSKEDSLSAQMKLGNYYEKGCSGIEQNPLKANECYQKARDMEAGKRIKEIQQHVKHFNNHFECKWDGMNKKHYIAFSPPKNPAEVLKYIQEKVPEEQQLDVIAGIYEHCVKEFPQAKNVFDDFLTKFAGFSGETNYEAADKFPQALGPHLDNEQQEFMNSMFQANRRHISKEDFLSAQMELGNHYEKGCSGVEQNPLKAMECYQKAGDMVAVKRIQEFRQKLKE